MTRQSTVRFLLVITVLLVAALACNMPGRKTVEVNVPIPVSSEAVGQLETQVVSAAQTAAAGGPIVLTLTEAQVTSAVAMQMEASGQQDLRDIQIRLRDGMVIVNGVTNQGGLDLPVEIKILVAVNADGTVKSTIADASVGFLPLPDSVITQLSTYLDEFIMAQIVASSGPVAVDSIVIADGYMTVNAHRR